MNELTELRRKIGDQTFIDLLNNIRLGQCSNDNRVQLQQSKINIKKSPPDATLIYAENKSKDDYNTSKLSKSNHPEITPKSIDVFSEITPLDLQTSPFSKLTGCLLLSLKLRKCACVMITTSIDLNDRLINGRFGIVCDFGFIDSSITKLYLKLDDENAGKRAMLKDSYALNHQLVPVQIVGANIKISKNSSQTLKRLIFH